jgi:hypothetical protein
MAAPRGLSELRFTGFRSLSGKGKRKDAAITAGSRRSSPANGHSRVRSRGAVRTLRRRLLATRPATRAMGTGVA